MTSSHDHPVFDLVTAGYKSWTFPAFGLILIAIGLLLPAAIRTGLLRSGTTPGPWFPRVFLGFALLWTTLSFLVTYLGYRHDRFALASGEAQYTEGVVTNFHPMPYEGHQDEWFSVNGIRFSYSDFSVTPGFNQTSSHGGPIREGEEVRIWYVGHDIVRLDLKKAEPNGPKSP